MGPPLGGTLYNVGQIPMSQAHIPFSGQFLATKVPLAEKDPVLSSIVPSQEAAAIANHPASMAPPKRVSELKR